MKFNEKSTRTAATTNYMGGKAFQLSPEMELYTATVTSFVDNTYYEKANARIERIRACIKQVAPEFVAKLAIYAREEMNLRSISMVLLIELARVHRGDNLVSSTVARVVQRADELTEVLAYFQAAEGRTGTKRLNKMPKQLQKGLAAAMNKFDEYQFAKYDRKSEVRLRDVLFLTHPKAKDEKQQLVFDKLAKGDLATPFTWETEISAIGQRNFENEKAKQIAISQAWEDLVTSGKMGYMATLRNLRNIILKSSHKALEDALKQLTQPEKVRKSKQLPFRFLSAYNEVAKIAAEEGLFESQKHKVEKALKALAFATEIAAANIPAVPGRTLILTDNSGSMRGDMGGSSAVSAMSKRNSADIANLFSVMYWTRAADTMVGLFGDRVLMPKLDRNKNIFENFKQVHEVGAQCGGATERGIFDMMEKLIREKIMVDQIIIFSDCQIGTGCLWYDNNGNKGADFDKLFKAYRAINPDVLTYSIDLRGYGNTLFSEGVVTLAGWSEKLFDLIAAFGNGVSAVEYIQTLRV